MQATDPVIEAVCRLPIDSRSLGDLSPVQLIRLSGYLSIRSAVTVERLTDCLVNHPDWVEAWFGWSEDKRGSPSWWLASAASSGYQVGYYDPTLERQAPPMQFSDKARACAEFVSRDIESIAGSIARIEAAREGEESDLDVARRLAQKDDRRE